MPKRSRSPEFGSPLQLKTHIGIKQMNESKEENMKAVYAKTHSLLFSASANSPARSNGAVPNLDGVCNGSSHPVTHLPHGQTILNAQGQIVPVPPGSPEKKVDDSAVTIGKMCTQCRQVCCGSISPCQYCEKPICRRCQQQCDECAGQFCLFCVVTNYEDRYERHLCVNCSS